MDAIINAHSNVNNHSPYRAVCVRWSNYRRIHKRTGSIVVLIVNVLVELTTVELTGGVGTFK